jgi:hypothetical protein
MSNFIIYHASSADEINECSYSLLKYLDVYNLKPPSDHRLVIYTSKPAQLELYGSLFHHFELHEISSDGKNATEKINTLNKFSASHNGNILLMGGATYPVKDLSMLFSNISRGTVYGSDNGSIQNNKRETHGIKHEPLSVLGFRSGTKTSINQLMLSRDLKSVKGFIEEYHDLREFRLLLKDFFERNQEESIPNLVRIIHPVNASEIESQKKKYLQLPVYTRLIRKMTGRSWNIARYASKL